MGKYDWLGSTGLQQRQERWKTGRKQVPGNAHLKLFSVYLKWEISMQWKSTPVRVPWIMGLHRHPACPGAGHPRGTLGLLWDASGFWTCSRGKTEQLRLPWEYEGASGKWFLRAYPGFLFPDPIRQFSVVVKLGDLFPPPSPQMASSCEKLWDLSPHFWHFASIHWFC